MTDRELLESLLQKVTGIEGKVTGIEGKVTGIEDKMSEIEDKMTGIESQLRENTDIIKAIVHRTDELDAKFDGLTVNMAKGFERVEERLEKIEQIQVTQGESINILAMRQFQNDTDIAALKKAK